MFTPTSIFSVDGVGFGIASTHNDTGTSQSFAMLQSMVVGGQGSISAQIGHLTASTSFHTQPLDAVSISGVVVDSAIHRDWRTIRVVMQVRDDSFNTIVNPQTVYAKAIQLGEVGAGCRPDSITGICTATIQLPAEWLLGGPIALQVGLSEQAMVTLNTTVAVNPKSAMAFDDSLMLTLPSVPVLPGKIFDVSVMARTQSDLESVKFSVFLESSESLGFVDNPTESRGDVWSYQFAPRADGLTVVMNRKPDAPAVTQNAQEIQELLVVRMRVKPGTAPGDSWVQLRIREMNAPIPIDPGGQPIADGSFVLGHVRGSVTHLSARGRISVAGDDVVGIMAASESGRGTFVNLAALTGDITRESIRTFKIHRYGRLLRSTNDAVCTDISGTEAEASIVVNARCNLVLSPVVQGSLSTAIQLVSGLHSTVLTVQVWAPVLPLMMVPEVSTLRPLDLWQDGPPAVDPDRSCAMRYLGGAVQATTSFTRGDGTKSSRVVDVTSAIKHRLMTNDSSIAVIDSGTAHVYGIVDGAVIIHGDSPALGHCTVTVDSFATHAYIASFDAEALSGLRVDTSEATVSPSGVISAQATLSRANFTREGTAGMQYLAASVQIHDPASGLTYTRDVTDSPSVHFRLTDPTLGVISAQSTITALRSGTSSLYAIWNDSERCPTSSTLQSKRSSVVATLPAATAAYFIDDRGRRLNAVTVAHQSDPAYIASSAPSTMALRVVCEYEDYTMDLTADPRSVLNTSFSEVAFVTNQCSESGRLCVFPLPGVNGDMQINVTFAHEPLVAMLMVHVVRGTRLTVSVSPYPEYPGSDQFEAQLLGVYAPTDTFQQAVLTPILHRSDGVLVPLDRAPPGSMQYTVGQNDAAAATDSDVAGSSRIVVAPSTQGALLVNAQFGHLRAVSGVIAANRLVHATRFYNLSLDGSSDATLYGFKDAPNAFQFRFGMRFDDGRSIPAASLFGDFDQIFRSQLVRFGSSDTAVEVNPSTGGLTLRGNSPTLVELTVSAIGVLDVMGQVQVHANLKAELFDVDLATDATRVRSLSPLESINLGDIVQVKVYVTSGQTPVGSLTLDLVFDPALLNFVDVVTGGDDGIWTDSVQGEVRSDIASIVRFGGVTTNYATGDSWHFATVIFRSTGIQGVAMFSGHTVEIAGSTANDLQASYTPFVAGDVSLIIGNINSQDQRRRATALTARRRQVQLQGCRVDAGPYPAGDVNCDCEFSGKDALLTAQYTLINDDSDTVKSYRGLHPTVSIEAMDADANQRVDTRDTSTLLYILFGALRFIEMPHVSLSQSSNAVFGCSMAFSIKVQQSSSDGTFLQDPSRADRTAIALLFTGSSQLEFTLPSLDWISPTPLRQLDDSGDEGRYAGYAFASHVPGTDEYWVSADALPGIEIGVSVIQVVSTAQGWAVPLDGQFLSAGTPFPASGKTENRQGAMSTQLDLPDGTTVPFLHSASFAPLTSVIINTSVSECTSERSHHANAFVCQDDTHTCTSWSARGFCESISQYMAVHCKASCGFCELHPPSSFPTSSASTAVPTESHPTASTTSSSPVPTVQPSLMPSTGAPSLNPSLGPTALPTSLPSSTPPSGMPSNAPSTSMPTTTLPSTTTPSTATPTALPSRAPVTSASTHRPTPLSPSMMPSVSPTGMPTDAPVTSVPPTAGPLMSTTSPSASPTGTSMIQIVVYPVTLRVGSTSPVELMVIYALAESATASNDAARIRVTLSAQSPEQRGYVYTLETAVVDQVGSRTVQIAAGELSLQNGGSYWLTVQLMVRNGILARDVKRNIVASTDSPTQTSLVPTGAPSVLPTIGSIDSAMIVTVNIGSYRVGVIRDRTIFIKFKTNISSVDAPVWRSAILDFFWAYFGVVSSGAESIAFYPISDGTVAVVEFATASLATRLRSAIKDVTMVVEVAGTSFLGTNMYLMQTDEGLTVVEDVVGFAQPTDPVVDELEAGSKKESSKSNNSLTIAIMPVAIAMVALALAVFITLGVVAVVRRRRVVEKSDPFDGYAEHFTIRRKSRPAYETPSWRLDKAVQQNVEAPSYIMPEVAGRKLEGAEKAWQDANAKANCEGYDNTGDDDGYEFAGAEKESTWPSNSELSLESDYELAAPTMRGGSPDNECDYQLAGTTVIDDCDYQLAGVTVYGGSANTSPGGTEAGHAESEFATPTEHSESERGSSMTSASLVSTVHRSQPTANRWTPLKRPPPVFPGDLIYNDLCLANSSASSTYREYLRTDLSVKENYATVSSCRGSMQSGPPIQGSALTKLVSQLTETLSLVSEDADSTKAPRSRLRSGQSSQISEISSTNLVDSRMLSDIVLAPSDANLEHILAMVGASDEASILQDYALMVESSFLDS